MSQVSIGVPANAAATPGETTLVRVLTDEPGGFPGLVERLREAGFAKFQLRSLKARKDPKIVVSSGPLGRLGAHVAVAKLAAAVELFVRDEGVEPSLYPLQLCETSGDDVEIQLPLSAIRAGRVLPWASHAREAYGVEIDCDSAAAGRALQKRLVAGGFARTIARRLPKINPGGFVISIGGDVPREISEAARCILVDALAEYISEPFEVVTKDGGGKSIEIDYPIRAWSDGRLAEELNSPAGYNFKVYAANAAVCEAIVKAERPRGWRAIHEDHTEEDAPRIQYGGAPLALVESVQARMTALSGVVLPLEKAWNITDRDVWVRLPATLTSLPAAAAAAEIARTPVAKRAVESLLDVNVGPPTRPFVVVRDREVVIGDIALPRREDLHPLTQDLAKFRQTVIDEPSALTLLFLAQTWRSRLHVALEGPTGVSKTTLISYFAAVARVPCFRLQLTETSDANDILGRVHQGLDGRFKWLDGVLPTAMRAGGIVNLDEANLCPSGQLERAFNGSLEPDPVLTLSEHDGSVLRGDQVHPDFRVLASWNPLDYAGRQELAPSLQNRLKKRCIPVATERDYLALARRLVFGEQPKIVVHEVCYGGGRVPPLFPALARDVPEVDRFLVALARFQVALEHAERNSGDAQRAYSRRDLIDCLSIFEDRLACLGPDRANAKAIVGAAWRAIDLAYVQGLDEGQRVSAVDLAAAHGLEARSWDLPE